MFKKHSHGHRNQHTVRGHHNILPRMRRTHTVKRRQGTRHKLLTRLNRWVRTAAGIRHQLGGGHQALQLAEAALLQALIGTQIRHPQALSNNLPTLNRAHQRGRHHPIHRHTVGGKGGELIQGAAHLLAPSIVQRNIGIALEAVLNIPVSQPVPQHEDTPGRVRLSAVLCGVLLSAIVPVGGSLQVLRWLRGFGVRGAAADLYAVRIRML